MVAFALGVLVVLSGPGSTPTAAAYTDDEDPVAPAFDEGVLDVVEVTGYLDRVLADYVRDAVESAADSNSIGIVLQINSPGSLISDAEFVDLAEVIVDSPVPVSVWVGPSGGKAEGAMAQLAAIGTDLAVAPGSRLGKTGDQILPEEKFGVLFGEAAPALKDSTIGSEEVIDLGLGREAPTLPFFALDLPGFEDRIDNSGDTPTRVPLTPVRFTKLELTGQLMHTVASPPVAYLLFIIGAALLVFEFYTAGVGIAGVVGAISFILGCYGLDVLPVRGWALGLLVLAILGYAIDVQTGVPRFWSVIATVALLIGSLFLYDGASLSWVTLIAGIVGLTSAMISGMPSMVRTRFGTPTIGREWMIGEMGVALENVSPDGIVVIRDAKWRARTNRATPIDAGDPVRVVSIEGLFLEVEPEDGAARDYRERARNG